MEISLKKRRTSLWDLYEDKILFFIEKRISLASVHKLIISEMDIIQKPTYDGFYRWIKRKGL